MPFCLMVFCETPLLILEYPPRLEISLAQSFVLVTQASSSHKSREIRARLDVPLIPRPFFSPLLFVFFFYVNAFRACRPKRPVTFHERSSFAWRRGLSFALHGGGLSRSEKSISLWERFQLRIKIGRRPLCHNKEKWGEKKRDIYRVCRYIAVMEFGNDLKIEYVWLLSLNIRKIKLSISIRYQFKVQSYLEITSRGLFGPKLNSLKYFNFQHWITRWTEFNLNLNKGRFFSK